jgi:hypothetical protein
MTLSYHGYINSLLFRLRPDGVKSASSPSTYVPPHYGSSAPQRPTSDYGLLALLWAVRGFPGPPGCLCPGQRPDYGNAAHNCRAGSASWLRGCAPGWSQGLPRLKHNVGRLLGRLLPVSAESRKRSWLVSSPLPPPRSGLRQCAHLGALDGHTRCMIVGAGVRVLWNLRGGQNRDWRATGA